MRSLLLVAAAAIQRHLGLPIFNPTERFVDADQPLSFVFGGWSWSQSFIDVVDHEPIISFISRPASFGPHITEQPGLPGYLIPVSSLATQCPDTNTPITPSILTDDDDLPENFSCLPICTDPSVSRPGIGTENWIALVQRGRCPFAEKVRAAQLLGAKAVVVGGWKPKEGDRDDLLNMFSPDDTSNITIPSTYVTYRSYTHLMGLIAASNTTTSGSQTISIIVRAEESWGWFSPIFTFLMLLLLPSFLTFLTLVIHRLREARRERLDRAPEDVVSHLPTRIWSGKGWEKEGDWLKKLRKRTQDEQDPGLEPSDKHIDDTSYDLERQDSARSMETCLEDSECVDHRGAPNAPHPEVHAHHDEECAIVDGTTTPSDDDIPGHDQPWFNGQIECAICLCAFDPGDKVRILPCGHLFHIEEVDGWLVQRKKLCPICKLDVTQPHPSTSSSPSTRSPIRNPTHFINVPGGPIRASRVRQWLSRSLPGTRPFLFRPSRRNTQPTADISAGDVVVSPPATERTPLLPHNGTIH